eukprot:GHVQ01022937.1.p1 GENE.GHVQ01022937.1~~GHVQ01022937.1.p1  ORF type:complete len:522 (-),score=66.15 GHVQ01022937.1:1075-2640(-)
MHELAVNLTQMLESVISTLQEVMSGKGSYHRTSVKIDYDPGSTSPPCSSSCSSASSSPPARGMELDSQTLIICDSLSSALDAVATLEATCFVFPSSATTPLWLFGQKEGRSEDLTSGVRRGGRNKQLLDAVKELYCLGLRHTIGVVSLAIDDMQDMLEFMFLRTKSFCCKCIVSRLRMNSAIDREQPTVDSGSEIQSIVSEQFAQWVLDFAEECGDHQIDMQRDMNACGVRTALEHWEKQHETDLTTVEWVHHALCGEEQPESSCDGSSADKADPMPTKRDQLGASAAALSVYVSSTDRSKISRVQEVLNDYSDGFILCCLRHWRNDVEQVIDGLLDGRLPQQLSVVDHNISLDEAVRNVENNGTESTGYLRASSARADGDFSDRKYLVSSDGTIQRQYSEGYTPALTDEEKKRIACFGREAINVYDDEADDTFGDIIIKAPADMLDLDDESDEESSSDDSDREETGPTGSPPTFPVTGRPAVRPVQGQTIQARRKEQNKSRIGNHGRRNRHLAKMSRGML